MDIVRAGLGLVGTAVIAGWVAYSVSAPRNADAYMNQEMESLDGKSINQVMVEEKDKSWAMHCERYQDLAQKQWDRSIANGTQEADADKIDELDRQVERFCNS